MTIFALIIGVVYDYGCLYFALGDRKRRFDDVMHFSLQMKEYNIAYDMVVIIVMIEISNL